MNPSVNILYVNQDTLREDNGSAISPEPMHSSTLNKHHNVHSSSDNNHELHENHDTDTPASGTETDGFVNPKVLQRWNVPNRPQSTSAAAVRSRTQVQT